MLKKLSVTLTCSFLIGFAAGGAPASAAAALPQASAAVAGGNLLAVSATSPADAWAVGFQCSNTICSLPSLSFSTLIEHWNGTTWSTVPSPNPDPNTGGDQLTAVSAVSATDAWAVGTKNCASVAPASCSVIGEEGDTLILHWNGSKWAEVPSPSPAPGTESLSGVTAISATDAWATGTYFSGSLQTLLLHWDGTKWTQVASPNPNGALLQGVSAASAADAWTAGRYIPSPSSPFSTLLVRWNGRKWTQVPSPSPGSSQNDLLGVSTVARKDAWAVGWYANPNPAQNLILHWNGTTWAQVASPDPGTFDDQLSGVSAISATDGWAVGQYSSGQGLLGSTLILRWDGTEWTQVASPNPDPSETFNYLLGVSTVSPTSAFAAGTSVNQTTGVYTALTARWNGTEWI